jgi:hypothetical protein
MAHQQRNATMSQGANKFPFVGTHTSGHADQRCQSGGQHNAAIDLNVARFHD